MTGGQNERTNERTNERIAILSEVVIGFIVDGRMFGIIGKYNIVNKVWCLCLSMNCLEILFEGKNDKGDSVMMIGLWEMSDGSRWLPGHELVWRHRLEWISPDRSRFIEDYVERQ